jgi:hypothetical protein
MLFSTINPLIAFGVVVTTGLTDAAYVMFTSAVLARKRIPAATWSSILYLLYHLQLLITRTIGSTSSLRLWDLGLALLPP